MESPSSSTVTIQAVQQGSQARDEWKATRIKLEQSGNASTVLGERAPRKALRRLNPYLRKLLELSGLYERGRKNAYDIKETELVFELAGLPAEFSDYKVLHLSDLHFPNLPETTQKALQLLDGRSYDLCILTGDYDSRYYMKSESVKSGMQQLMEVLQVRDGYVAVLGNHDGHETVAMLEDLGVTVLTNQSVELVKGAAKILFTGTDDVSVFYTSRAVESLQNSPRAFKIALVHSPELAEVAEKSGYSLYLSGHTHGGQVCYPTGKPIVTFLRRHMELAKGQWKYGTIQGYTSSGLGVAVLPVRYYCQGEITSITLKPLQG